MVNEWIAEGTIISEVLLRHTKDSMRPVLNIMLCIDDHYRAKKNLAKDKDYLVKKRVIKVPLVAWHDKATEISQTIQQGDKVRVKGSIRTRLVKRDNGTYPTFEVVLEKCILLSRTQ